MGSARCGPTSGPAATRRAVDGSKRGCQTQEQPRAEARTIKIRDISASEMRAAADAGQMLVVTTDDSWSESSSLSPSSLWHT
jgi:hypothetical protein